MKKHTIVTVSLGLVLFVTACKKNDVQTEANVPVATEATVASGWKTVSKWTAESGEGYSMYSSGIEDNSITADVASNGLVLVFKKGAQETATLPAEEKATGSSYFWYYQVSEGSLVINADAYGTAAKPTSENIRYYVLTEDKLADLETKGYSKAELMRLSYENAAALLK